jgi:hypothetical protein
MNENEILNLLDNKINKIYFKSNNRLTLLDEGFNQIKNYLLKFSQQYENKKNKILNQIPKIKIEDFEPKIKEIISKERELNINYIDNILNKYSNDEYFNINKNNKFINDQINNTQIECNNILQEINNKLNLLKNNREKTMNIMINEMNNEINTINKNIDDNNLDNISSNNDRANAIQDMLKIFLNKFKTEQKEKNNFEDKITNLLEELLDKMSNLKN